MAQIIVGQRQLTDRLIHNGGAGSSNVLTPTNFSLSRSIPYTTLW
jgi:hypothetical protein